MCVFPSGVALLTSCCLGVIFFIIATAVRARNNGNGTPFLLVGLFFLLFFTRVTWNGTDGRQAFQRFVRGVCCPLGVKGVGVRGRSQGCLRTAGALRGAHDDMHMAHGRLLQSYRDTLEKEQFNITGCNR